jgi:REP element-mobilizing transposase RayT
MSRGNDRRDIFIDDDDRRDFLELLGRAARRFNLRVFAFCLMNNHFHLFLQTPDANLAPALKWLKSAYAGRFNRRHQRVGHLFQGRYKAVLTQNQAHWIHLSHYLHLNPRRAALVEDPAAYEWSSCRDYLAAKSRFDWLDRDHVLALYGRDPRLARRQHRKQLAALAGAEPDFWTDFTRNLAAAAQDLMKSLINKHQPAGKTASAPDFTKLARKQDDPHRVLAEIAKAFGVKPEDLMRRQRDFPPRLAAYLLLPKRCGMKIEDVAKLMGVGPSAVSMGAKRFSESLAADKSLRKIFESLTVS